MLTFHGNKVYQVFRRVMDKSDKFFHANQFYRINYDPGVCLSPDESLDLAIKLMREGARHLHPTSECSRRSFVHYLKTGESSDINVDDLPDDRMLLPREEIRSAMELKPGDHIERPLAGLNKYAKHHMLVVKPIDNQHCRVIHYHVHPTLSDLSRLKKGKVMSEIVNIFEQKECLRVCYSERVDPEKGLYELSQLCGEEGKENLKGITGNVSYCVTECALYHIVR